MPDAIAISFDRERERLRALAFRMLGSAAEAEDAVQDAWFRLNSADADQISNLRGWLTTVVSRIALDILRARKARGEAKLDPEIVEPIVDDRQQANPEREVLLAEAVGIGLLIILDQLEPPERIAFVLHDIFGVSFEDIAPIVDRSTVATRQLASRARRRIRRSSDDPTEGSRKHRRLVEAFFAASRDGDFAALLRLLDPNASMRIDIDFGSGLPSVTKGAAMIAKRAQLGAASRAKWSDLMMIDGSAGIVVAPFGQIHLVMLFKAAGDRIIELEIVTDRHRLDGLHIDLWDQQRLDLTPTSSRAF